MPGIAKKLIKRFVQGMPGRVIESVLPGIFQLPHRLFGIFPYVRDYLRFLSMSREGAAPRFADIYPCLDDRYVESGVAKGHYFFQDLWAARKIFESKPSCHYDVGSRVDGFVAHVLVFCDVKIIDIRKLVANVERLSFINANVCQMTEVASGSIESLSSLHAIEHVGLGRYGDPIDPDGYVKAIAELDRVLAPGGNLYFGVPIGRERICFNAHRIFDPMRVLELFSNLRLVEFSAVDDLGDFHRNAPIQEYRAANYALGLYHFTKVATG